MLEDLLGNILQLNKNLSLTNYVMQGVNKYFCNGTDPRPLISAIKMNNYKRVDDIIDHEFITLYAIQCNDTPIISYLNGSAINYGAKLAYSTQFRFANENSTMQFDDLSNGLIPYGVSYLLSRIEDGIGYYISLTGHLFKAQELLDFGLASYFTDASRRGLINEECRDIRYKDLKIIDSLLVGCSSGNIGDISRFGIIINISNR